MTNNYLISRAFLLSLNKVLARVGFEFMPLLRRIRSSILRPVKHEIAILEQQNESLRSNFLKLEQQNESLRSNFLKLEQQNESLKSNLLKLEQQNESLKSNFFKLEQRNECLSSNFLKLEQVVAGSFLQHHRIGFMSAGSVSPKVSIIMSTRNQGKFIHEAVLSVQAQYFSDWELIIVNDGSEDDTSVRLAPFLVDQRIKYLERPFKGSAAARNDGLLHACGELIAYIDSDNIWYSGFLGAAVRHLNNNPLDNLVYGVLVSESHDPASLFFFYPFNREQLHKGNFIDLNVLVHRRILFEKYGGFDEALSRLIDWDLVLRYTRHQLGKGLPVLACEYRDVDPYRITRTQPYAPNLVKILRKQPPGKTTKLRPRILYVLWHYPQLSETYIEAEIRQMQRWGAHIEVWRDVLPVSPYSTGIRIHDGKLIDAINKVKPDLIHIHWLSFAASQEQTLLYTGIPVTIRLHGFDSNAEGISSMLSKPWVRTIYGFPQHIQVERTDIRLKNMLVAFETDLFRPTKNKNRRLVVRTCAGLPSKDIPFFFELAKQLPEFRFVIALVTCNQKEYYIEELKTLAGNMNSPVEIRVDVPRTEIAALVSEAGIYVYTTNPIGTEQATPIGMPISIAEAMATGAYVLARDANEFIDYIGDAGGIYSGVEQASRLISETQNWSDEIWSSIWLRAVERAYGRHADEIVLRQIFNDWMDYVLDVRGQFEPAEQIDSIID